MKNIKQSDVLHEGKKVYYVYPNTCEDPEDFILSWLNDYIKDDGAESANTVSGEFCLTRNVNVVFIQDGTDLAFRVHPRDIVLLPYNDGWLYIRLEDSGLMNCEGVKGKINRVQYWYD